MSFRPVSFQMGSCAGLRMGWGRGGGRGRGVICRWQWGIVVSAERLFGFFVFFFFSFCFSQSLTFFFFWLSLNAFNLFWRLPSLGVKPCIGDLWGFGCQILLLRWKKKKERIHVDLCVHAHTYVCLRHVDGCSEAAVEAASSHLHLILGALLCKCGRRKKTSRLKVLSLHKEVGDKKKKQVTRCLDCP